MREAWRSVNLGCLFKADNRRLGSVADEPPVFSLSKHDGLVLASEYFDARVASADLRQYKVVPPGGWAYSNIHIDEGSIARNVRGELGVISPMYTTLSWCSADHDPGFFALLLRTPKMLAEYKARAQGTVDRRRSLRLSAFAAITVDVPPLAEQRRIVDLVAAVDTARFSDRVTDACGAAARALMNEIMASASDWVALASVVSKARAGGTPSRQEPSFFGGSIPWLKSGEVDADWIDRATESLTEPGLANSSAWVMPSRSIVIAMYGQGLTAGSVGFTAVPMAANQAVLGLVPDPNRVEPRFLFHWLRSRKDSMRDRRSGSSQPNLNKETVIQEPVPVVELDRQRVVASVLDALSETSGNSSKVVAAAERARTALVADLLSGEHEIPESYDRFLEGAS